jgi:hypothetical protein
MTAIITEKPVVLIYNIYKLMIKNFVCQLFVLDCKYNNILDFNLPY